MTSNDVTVVADATDPALTKLLAPPAPASAGSWFDELSGWELASLVTWLGTFGAYVVLGRAVGKERDPELSA